MLDIDYVTESVMHQNGLGEIKANLSSACGLVPSVFGFEKVSVFIMFALHDFLRCPVASILHRNTLFSPFFPTASFAELFHCLCVLHCLRPPSLVFVSSLFA